MTGQPSVVEVLVAHQRQGSSACLCGPMRLGSSHAQHQADALAAAGLLASGPTRESEAVSDNEAKLRYIQRVRSMMPSPAAMRMLDEHEAEVRGRIEAEGGA